MAEALLFAAGVIAQTPTGFGLGTNQPPGFAVTLLPGERVGHEQIVRGLIRSGTNEFMFVVPEGLRTQTPSEGTIVLTSRDMSYYLSIRIVGPAPASPGLQEALREQIANQFPNVSSMEEFTATVANREGTGFQLRQELAKGGSRLIRILWSPFKAGVLEFALNANSNSALAGQGTFDMILLTFRSNERGRLEFVRRSEKT
jgi:hypothetical protein